MYLKRLEIHGFKSFATKTTLEFAQGIIAIVGPNGSGKSNVADSLRWVLGEQSAKIIRGKKSEDVIFAGSDKKGKLGFAEVVATFDNRDRRIPVDSAEVSIGRRIDRSGESEYLINNNKVRLLDIVDLVLKSNIGTSRYTVIGQGTIDQMVLAGPAEVKNLLDEASGVKTYYIKREKTLRRLEQTAQNLMRAEDLISEIEPRLKSLRRQAKRMEARVDIEAELKIYQRELLGKNYWNFKTVVNTFVSQLLVVNKQREDLEQNILFLRQQAEKLESKDTEQVGQFKEIQEQLSKLQSQKNKLLEDLSLVRGKMQSQKTMQAGDPITLKIQAHEIARKLEQAKEQIGIAEQNQAAARTRAAEQMQLITTVNAKLETLYKNIQAPAAINWDLFELELVKLEQLLNDFYHHVETGAATEHIRPMADNFKHQFLNFRKIAKDIAVDPQAAMGKFQAELKELSITKEQLSGELSGFEMDAGKSGMALEFLQKDWSALEQQKLQIGLELTRATSTSQDDFLQTMLAEETRIQKEADAMAGQISQIEVLFKTQQESQSGKQKALHAAESELRTRHDELSNVKDQIAVVNVEKAKVDTQTQAVVEEIIRTLGQEALTSIASMHIPSETQDLESKIAKLKNQLDMIGGMDDLTVLEYQETETRYTTLTTQVEDLKRGMQDLRNIMDELDEHIKKKFNEAFYRINEKFEHYFRVLFNGGRAYLSVVKAEDEHKDERTGSETEEEVAHVDSARPEQKIVEKYEKGVSNIIGIDIKATPPNKKLASIQALSGGERALTAIALLCSMLTCFPSPFVVLDEVDAALDDANTIRFGQILGTLAHQTQFITITHNRETMAQSNILYGVTMGDDGVSKLLSVKLEQAKAFAK